MATSILTPILVTLLSLITISFVFTLLAGALKVFRPKLINARAKFTVEDVQYYSKDQFLISAWWVMGKPDQPIILMCHGVGANRADLLPIANDLQAAGYGLLMIDFRAHGESSGLKTSFGYRERADVVASIKYLQESGKLKGRTLCLYGLSMGAASICMAASEIHQIAPVKAIALDSSFARFAPIIKMSTVTWSWLAKALFFPLVSFVGNKIFQVPAFIINPISSIVGLSPAKLLIIHSEIDELIPIEHGHKLFEAAREPKEFWHISDCLHAEIFLKHQKAYSQRLIEFYSK